MPTSTAINTNLQGSVVFGLTARNLEILLLAVAGVIAMAAPAAGVPV